MKLATEKPVVHI